MEDWFRGPNGKFFPFSLSIDSADAEWMDYAFHSNLLLFQDRKTVSFLAPAKMCLLFQDDRDSLFPAETVVVVVWKEVIWDVETSESSSTQRTCFESQVLILICVINKLLQSTQLNRAPWDWAPSLARFSYDYCMSFGHSFGHLHGQDVN